MVYSSIVDKSTNLIDDRPNAQSLCMCHTTIQVKALRLVNNSL